MSGTSAADAPTRAEFEALLMRTDELLSRQQIGDLVYRYTEFVRDRNECACAALMTDDAWVELHHGDALDPRRSDVHERFVGKDQITGSFGQVAGSEAVVWPMIHNLRIEIDGDTASSRCIMASSVRPHGMQFIGEYRDTYRREHGQWLFTSRIFMGVGAMEGGSSDDAHAGWQEVKT